MRVRTKTAVYLNHKSDLRRIKIPAGSIGILDDIESTFDNAVTVATVRFPEGLVLMNPSAYEVVNDYEDEISTNPGCGATSWRLPETD